MVISVTTTRNSPKWFVSGVPTRMGDSLSEGRQWELWAIREVSEVLLIYKYA